MELPDDVLQLIKEYSMPVTRPEWRHLHLYTKKQYYDDLYKRHIIRYRVDDTLEHMICIRNILLILRVTKTEMNMNMIKRTVWP